MGGIEKVVSDQWIEKTKATTDFAESADASPDEKTKATTDEHG